MILTADEICKAVGARAASERWLKDAQAIESALLAKLRGGMELLEPIAFCDDKVVKGSIGSCASKDAKAYWAKGDFIDRARFKSLKHPLCTIDAAKQYGDARALAASERGTCTWTEQDDKDMPGTYESSCGEMWSFIDGGVKENRVTYCHHCGGKVVLAASPQEQT